MLGDRFAEIKETFLTLTNKRELLKRDLEETEMQLQGLQKRLDDIKKAREVINVVAEKVQGELEGFIGAIVTQALEAVFPDPYVFVLRFVRKYNKTHCNVFLKKAGVLLDPMDTTGAGPKDIVALAARVAFVQLQAKRLTIIADEPFKFLHSAEYQQACSEMISALAKDAGFQFIIVSDQTEIKGDNLIDLPSIIAEQRGKYGKKVRYQGKES